MNEEKNQNEEIIAGVRKLSQHFLVDQKVIDDLVFASETDREDTILEIGPGRGNITKRLVEVADKVIAVEYDKRLAPYLNELSKRHNNLEIIFGDILKIRFPNTDRIISNIPFNITEPLITKLLNEKFKSASFIVGETYGKQATTRRSSTRLGLLTKAYFNIDYVRAVPSGSFDPEPATDCSIITLYPLKKQEIKTDFRLYILRCIWDQKTRPLKDALSAAIFQYTGTKGSEISGTERFVSQVKKSYNHPLNKRVDNLTNPEFTDLYSALKRINIKKLFGGHKPRGGARNWRKDFSDYI